LSGREIPATTSLTSRVTALHTRSRCPRPRWRRCESSPWHRPWLRFAPCHRGRWQPARARPAAESRL